MAPDHHADGQLPDYRGPITSYCKFALTSRAPCCVAVTYNTTSKPRSFEIANLGEFPFTFRLFAKVRSAFAQVQDNPATNLTNGT